MSSEDEYTNLTQEFINAMMAVDADLDDYVAGLRAAKCEIETTISAAEEDIARRDG